MPGESGSFQEKAVVLLAGGLGTRLRPAIGELPKVLAPRHQAVRLVQAGVPATEVADRTYPTVLNVNSYLFVDALMTREKRDTIFYSGDRITYRYPIGQISRLMNLVYSAGESRVYR